MAERVIFISIWGSFMARKAKKFDISYKFSERFTQLCETEPKHLAQWGELFGVTRQTITNWQMRDASPDIIKLTSIARHFGVSTDYLLGLSDTKSPDISVRATAEYTGLSEEAVEKLHNGIVDNVAYGARLNQQKRYDYLRIASEFICSNEFSEIIHRLANAEKCAHKEALLRNLNEDRFTALTTNHEGDSVFARPNARLLTNAIFDYINSAQSNLDGLSYKTNKFDNSTDKKIKLLVSRKLSTETDNSELHQFHVAKALGRFIDGLLNRSKAKGAESFLHIQNSISQ